MKNYAIELIHFSVEDRTRFWSHVDRRGPSECWLWAGATSTADGVKYGVWRWHSLVLRPHRVAWVLTGHDLDPELTLDHVKARGCTSKLCCNPAHLEQVTQSENTLRLFRDPGRLYSLTCKHGHAKEFNVERCRRCLSAAVARSQSKRADYYREMKTRNKREQRARQ